MAWRFDVDTSEVPKGDSSSKWEVSRNTNTAFKLLAATSCRILAGCKRRCLRSRASGYKQASSDTLSWISQTYNGRQVPCVKLQEMCVAMLKIQEKPTQRPNSAPLQQSSTGDMEAPPHARESDEDEGPWDAADSAFSDDLFKTGCVLFTQFYRERTKEIRLAYVCGYRDALDDIMKWGSRNRTPGQNSISAATLTGICTLMRSRASTRESGGTPQRASSSLLSSSSSSSSSSRMSTPLNVNLNLGGDVDVLRTQGAHTPSRSIVRPTPTSSPSRCVGSARSPLVRAPSQNDVGLTDPMAMWLPGNGNKREFVMDTDDDDEPMLENPKRARFG